MKTNAPWTRLAVAVLALATLTPLLPAPLAPAGAGAADVLWNPDVVATDPGLSAFMGTASALLGTKIYYFGCDTSACDYDRRHVAVFDIVAQSLVSHPNVLNFDVIDAGAFSDGADVYVVGGCQYVPGEGCGDHNRISRFDPETLTLDPVGWARGYYDNPSVAWDASTATAFIVGFRDLSAYRPSTGVTEFVYNLPLQCDQPSIAAYAGNVYIVGGGRNPYLSYGGCYAVDSSYEDCTAFGYGTNRCVTVLENPLVLPTWSKIVLPEARTKPAAAVHGSNLLIFGGYETWWDDVSGCIECISKDILRIDLPSHDLSQGSMQIARSFDASATVGSTTFLWGGFRCVPFPLNPSSCQPDGYPTPSPDVLRYLATA